MNKLLLLLAVGTLFIASCGTPKPTPTEELVEEEIMEDTVREEDELEPVYNYDTNLHDIWVVKSIKGTPWPKGIAPPRLELFPSEGRISGYAGCNEFFGGCTVNGQNITFARIGTTKKFCKDAMDLETQFISTLQDVDSYRIKSLQLMLGTAGNSVMELQKVD